MTLTPSPTHFKGTFETWIDFYMVASTDAVHSIFKSPAPFICGHSLISATIKLFSPMPTPKIIEYRNFGSLNSVKFNEYLRDCDWSNWSDHLTVDEKLFLLESNLTKSLDFLAPYKVSRSKDNVIEPWITPDLRIQKKERKRLYRKYKRHKTQLNLQNYRSKRDLLYTNIKLAKIPCYKERLTKFSDPHKLWTELKQLGLTDSPILF